MILFRRFYGHLLRIWCQSENIFNSKMADPIWLRVIFEKSSVRTIFRLNILTGGFCFKFIVSISKTPESQLRLKITRKKYFPESFISVMLDPPYWIRHWIVCHSIHLFFILINWTAILKKGRWISLYSLEIWDVDLKNSMLRKAWK